LRQPAHHRASRGGPPNSFRHHFFHGQVLCGMVSRAWAGSSVGTSVRLKSGRSAVRPRPCPQAKPQVRPRARPAASFMSGTLTAISDSHPVIRDAPRADSEPPALPPARRARRPSSSRRSRCDRRSAGLREAAHPRPAADSRTCVGAASASERPGGLFPDRPLSGTVDAPGSARTLHGSAAGPGLLHEILCITNRFDVDSGLP